MAKGKGDHSISWLLNNEAFESTDKINEANLDAEHFSSMITLDETQLDDNGEWMCVHSERMGEEVVFDKIDIRVYGRYPVLSFSEL